jgi:hypothetical protein
MHEIEIFYNWLVDNGLWKSAVGWVIGVLLGAASAWIPFKRHRKAQDQVIDLLRTDTPGGLGTLVEAIQQRSNTDAASNGGHDPVS